MKREQEVENKHNQHLSKIENKFIVLEERMCGNLIHIIIIIAYQEKSRNENT